LLKLIEADLKDLFEAKIASKLNFKYEK